MVRWSMSNLPPEPPDDPTGSGPYPGQQPPPYGQQPPPYGQQPYPMPAGGASGGGYGSMPAPGQPTYAPRRFQAMDALSYAWTALTKNPLPFLLIGLLTLIIGGGLSAVGAIADGTLEAITNPDAMDPATSSTQVTFTPVSSMLNLVSSAIAMFLSLGIYRMALDVMDGRKAELGRLFSGYNVLMAFVVSIVVGLIVLVGLVACILPGIAAMILLYFAPVSVVDEDLSLGDAIKGSFEAVKDNLGQVLLGGLIGLGLAIVVLCTCGLGAIVVTPLAGIAVAYAWRAMRGRPIAQPV